MAKETKRLTTKHIENAKHPIGDKKTPVLVPDGNGLYLQVTRNGGKSRVL